jgi:hypothetical protein
MITVPCGATGAWANGEILYFSHQAAVVTG